MCRKTGGLPRYFSHFSTFGTPRFGHVDHLVRSPPNLPNQTRRLTLLQPLPCGVVSLAVNKLRVFESELLRRQRQFTKRRFLLRVAEQVIAHHSTVSHWFTLIEHAL